MLQLESTNLFFVAVRLTPSLTLAHLFQWQWVQSSRANRCRDLCQERAGGSRVKTATCAKAFRQATNAGPASLHTKAIPTDAGTVAMTAGHIGLRCS